MIYLMAVAKTAGGGGNMEKQVILMEKEMIEDILKGAVVTTPDGRVMLGYCPDPAWTQEQLGKADGGTRHLAEVIYDGAKRPHNPSTVTGSMTVLGATKDGEGKGRIAHAEGDAAPDLLRQFQEGLNVSQNVIVAEKVGGRPVDVERVTKPSTN